METITTQQTPHLTIDRDKNKRYSVAFSPDGTLLTGDKDNTIRLWDITTAQEKKMFWVDIGECCTSAVRSVAFSPDGRIIAGGVEETETICLWDVATSEQLKIL